MLQKFTLTFISKMCFYSIATLFKCLRKSFEIFRIFFLTLPLTFDIFTQWPLCDVYMYSWNKYIWGRLTVIVSYETWFLLVCPGAWQVSSEFQCPHPQHIPICNSAKLSPSNWTIPTWQISDQYRTWWLILRFQSWIMKLKGWLILGSINPISGLNVYTHFSDSFRKKGFCR